MGQIWGSEKIMGQNMGQGTHLRRIFDELFCDVLFCDALFCDALFWFEKNVSIFKCSPRSYCILSKPQYITYNKLLK